MTREGYNKYKELIEAWGNGVEIEYYCMVNKKWFATKNPAWDSNIQYRVKPTKIEFEDCSFNDREYCLSVGGAATLYLYIKELKPHSKKAFKDKKVAEAYAVLPQLIRLKDEYNEGWKPDWNGGEDKCVIFYYGNELKLTEYQCTQRLLAFKTPEIRDKFLKDHKDLLEIAKPLL